MAESTGCHSSERTSHTFLHIALGLPHELGGAVSHHAVLIGVFLEAQKAALITILIVLHLL